MKKLLILLFSVLTLNIQAQTFISCQSKQYYIWNTVEEKFKVHSKLEEEPSLFTFPEGERLFTHVTPSMTSTYYIRSTDFNDTTKLMTISTISDVGNKYLYILDTPKEEIRVLFKLKEDYYLIVFKIKNIF